MCLSDSPDFPGESNRKVSSMCGIVGWVRQNGEVDTSTLARMLGAIRHRGPDGEKIWVSDCGSYGLAHARLAIIDLSQKASQPMVSVDGKTIIVFNGEVYNSAELRLKLESQGVLFRSHHSDTETLLEAYRKWGLEKTLSSVNGMFAFSILDFSENLLIAARDRIGIKPFYYCRNSSGFLFASEIKSLLEHPSVTAKLNQNNLNHQLAFRALPAPMTLFEGIYKLGPGQILRLPLSTLNVSVDVFWNPLDQTESVNSRSDAIELTGNLLSSSIGYRVCADVPVGVFLSGGLDSALVAKFASARNRSLKTFTIRYPDYAEYNEHLQAREIAYGAGLEHQNVDAPGDLFANSLAAVAYHQDEPVSAPVCVSVFLLSQAARKSGVPVILTGEGGDEIFVGYNNWIKLRQLQGLDSAIPGRWLRFVIHSLVSKLASDRSRVRELTSRSRLHGPLFWSGGMDFTGAERSALLGIDDAQEDTFQEVIEPAYSRFRSAGRGQDHFGWMIYQDMQLRLPELMLMRLDKMTMAFGVEGRVPLLDHRLAELALNLTNQLRDLSVRETKWLLKAVAEKFLPRAVIYQQKKGFQAPVREWKDSVLRTYAKRLNSFARRTGVFDVEMVDKVLHRKDDRLYFSLINIMLWHEIFVEGKEVEDYQMLLSTGQRNGR